MSNSFNKGDVWLANVLFRDSTQTKQRPIVLVGNDIAVDIDVIMVPVTSQSVRGPFDVVIEYWKEAGLYKPSVARVNKIGTIHHSSLIRRLGVLHEHDLERVLHMCKNLF